ncbi:LuxR family transcriptional regulator [Sphingomonas gilva]|uniref:LuxR family transcriptional regulator n=1 Tax=Sphingomonas gilva TaxID=2305907 RepID=A0A396RLZ0_9SPHN|nr:helix-turn-helix transcriptional regulator [Sphingomonas gilva]RHW17358.1 LuxR family transcriptional regulator [Sphingomonas gilva]
MASKSVPAVPIERLARLTPGQRVCLRLVHQRLTSKDIAREIGISPHTVDQRLRQAIEILGVSSRVEAARAFAAAEADGYQSLIYQAPYIAEDADPAPALSPDIGDRWREANAVHEMQAPYLAFASSQPARFIAPLPVRRGERNDLTIMQRLGWTIAVAVGTALSAGIFLSGIEALGTIATAAKRALS